MSLNKKLILLVFFLLSLQPIIGFNIESFGPLLFFFSALFLKDKKLTTEDLKFIASASLFYLFTITTMLYTENIQYGYKEILKGISIFIIPLTFSFYKKQFTTQNIKVFLRIYVLSLFFFGGYLIFYIINTLELNNLKAISLAFSKFSFKYSLLGEDTYKSIHPTYFSAGLVLGTLICLENFILFKEKSKKIISIIITFFFLFLLLILKVRIAIIALIVVIPIYLFFTLKTFRKRVVLLISVVISLSIFSIFIINNNGLRKSFYNKAVVVKESIFNNELNDKLITSRIDIYKSSIEIIKESLIFGVGVGDVNDKLREKYKLKGLKEFYESNLYNSHNQYLHYALAGGIFGFIIFIYCLVYNFNYSIKNRDYLYMSFLLLFSIIILTENLLNRINGIFFFAIFNSLFHYRNKYLVKTQKIEK